MDTRLQEALSGKNFDYIAPFLWLHEDPDDKIIEEIGHIYDAGIRSVCIESRTHESFCRDGWWSDVALILEECRKRGMHVWILDDKHFPSGYADGMFCEDAYRDLQPWAITEKHIDVTGPVKDGSAIASGWFDPGNDTLIGVSAIRHDPDKDTYSGECLDLSAVVKNGMVYFDLPEGMWRIVFLIKTRSGYRNWECPYCDVLNPESVRLYLDRVYEPHYAHFPEEFGKTFRGFFSDEPRFHNNSASPNFLLELGEQFAHYPWREKVLDALREHFGDKAVAYLPGLWYEIKGVTPLVRHAYMDFITREYAKNFCAQIGDWCRAHGIEYIGHIIEDNHIHAMTASGPGHYFRSLWGQDMAGIDVVLHQIIPGLTECSNAGSVAYKHMEQGLFHYELGKLASSLSHIDPKKQGRAMCEIFGAYGWAEGSKIMKYLMDHMLVRGINYYVPHAFSPKENDGDCPPNFYDTGKNPQYRYFRYLMDYLNRTSHLLSGGIHNPTCAILYDAENRWIRGDFLPLEKIGKALYDALLDYDILPADVLPSLTPDGKINGETYPLLLVPDTNAMPEEIGTILRALPIPAVVISRDGGNRTGLDLPAVALDALPGYLTAQGLRDVSADGMPKFLRYMHYSREGAEIYMFSNENIHETADVRLHLSGFAGGDYAVYDAFENRAYRARSMDGTIPLTVPPYHAYLLFTGDITLDGVPEKEEKKPCVSVPLTPVFRIGTITHNEDIEVFYRETDTLFNITGPDALPYFSGHIRYEAELTLPAGCRYLDLGRVGEIAEVSLNGKPVGIRMFPPYRFDIASAAKEGKNTLSVLVTNTNGYERRDPLSRYLLFEPSGLLGPVSVLKEQNV